MKRTLLLTVALLLVTATELAQTRPSPELAFNIPAQRQHLLSPYKSKVVALEFISTTCPHCQEASRVMTAMQNRFGNRDFQALDVAINPNADLLVENFAKEFHVVFPVGWTSIEQMMSYMGFADRPVVPQLVLLDGRGNIHYQTSRIPDPQDLNPETIAARIESLIALMSRKPSHFANHVLK